MKKNPLIIWLTSKEKKIFDGLGIISLIWLKTHYLKREKYYEFINDDFFLILAIH